jgi:hypothetical protein
MMAILNGIVCATLTMLIGLRHHIEAAGAAPNHASLALRGALPRAETHGMVL